ncbi:MAG: hypothetical protein VKL42_07645 [Snowella sp.]|nr:hypothetical protein [Snowella sp.]
MNRPLASDRATDDCLVHPSGLVLPNFSSGIIPATTTDNGDKNG